MYICRRCEMKSIFTLLLAILALLAIAGCDSSQYFPGEATADTPTPILVPKTYNLVNGVITVGPNDYYHVQFIIDTDSMLNVKVEGTFRASGGSGNDIEVMILDDMAYTNWINGHTVSAIYFSGKLTTSNIDAEIVSSGKYHLVFSNEFSIISSKDVSTKVDLNWSELSYP